MTANRSSLDSTTDPVGPPPSRSRLRWLSIQVLPAGLFLLTGFLLIVLLGVAQRIGWLRDEAAPAVASSAESGMIFTCPMHPQIRQPSEGRCPICGMELVPASSGAADLNEFSVKIEPAQRRLAHIETAPAEVAPLEATLQTVGAIAIDESRQATISAYIDARLERLFANYTGVDIAQGDHLAVIYSPQLYAAQVEYLEARRTLSSAAGIAAMDQLQRALTANTRQRLTEYGMTEEQIGELERTGKAQSRLTIYAPQGGTVVEKLAVEGNYVKAGDPIYRIAELSTVWLMLKLFPEDAARIRFGQRVQAIVQSLPGETLTGRVAFVDPTVDPQTRTVGVRVELLNQDRRLRPGDYGEAHITLPIGPQGQIYDADLAGKWLSPMHPQIIRDAPGACPICGMELVPASNYGFAAQPTPQPESLFVPRAAVLMAGGNSVVYVETEPGRFEIRPVTVGPILRDKIVILTGLKVGENVATAGNFLIDSQMQLAGKPSLIDPTKAMAKSQKPAGPLEIPPEPVLAVTGAAGTELERLYTAYFEVQRALAGDQTPPAESAQALHAAASTLVRGAQLPATAIQLAQQIVDHSAHLHHHDLAAARREFKPISHAIVTLAAQARPAGATTTLIHFYCPMVKDGGGDWLQADDQLLNPYFGSEMLRCGEKVRELSPASPRTPATALPPSQDEAPADKAPANKEQP